MKDTLTEINKEMEDLAVGVDLPPVEIPEGEVDEGLLPDPLIRSDWGFAEASQRLKADRDYQDHQVGSEED